MKYDKKGELAKFTKLKLQTMLEIGEKNNWNNKLLKHYSEGLNKGYYENPNFKFLTDEQEKVQKLYQQGRYFTSKEKSLIVDYLIDCLVNNEQFDCSTLGPNEYLEEIK